MKRSTFACIGAIVLAASPCVAQEEPIDVGTQERVEVDLMLVETLVLDPDGRTVPGLTRDDFVLTVGGKSRTIDLLDARCNEALDDPLSVRQGESRPPLPVVPRKVVFVFDYYHLFRNDRAVALSHAYDMLARNKPPQEEVMVAALADGLRIEQRFTRDLVALGRSLQRMEHDVTLYARDFQPGTERSFFDNLQDLMNLLIAHDGPKAVVLFSSWTGRSDEGDLWYQDLAMHAAAARTVLYPVDPRSVMQATSLAGSPSLARLANESGGRLTVGHPDLSVAYARAQRDLACRYTVGFYVEPGELAQRQSVRVRVDRPGLETRAPEVVRAFSAEEQRESRLRAAFVDPQAFDNPYVRAWLFPIRLASKKAWDTLVAVSFPMPVEPQGADVHVGIELRRARLPVGIFQRAFHIEPSRSGETMRTITILGETELKPGDYTMTVAVEKQGAQRIHTTAAEWMVARPPDGRTFIRGPVLARVVDDGVLIRVEGKDKRAPEARLPGSDLLAPDEGVEPLLVYRVAPGDRLLSRWEACVIGAAPAAGTIARRIETRDGDTVHELDPVPLRLDGKVPCQGMLDAFPAGTLAPGKYRIRVDVRSPEGETLASSFAPLMVAADEAE